MNKTLTKLMLDIILTILFILLIYPKETGYPFHEITGLASGALVIIHLMVNWSWVKSVSGNLFNPKLKIKSKLFYLLNTLSLAVLAAVIITGIQISVVLFPNQAITSHNLVLLHKWLSYACLGLFVLHLALHWGFFVHTVPRMFKNPGRPSFAKVALNVGALVLTLGLLVSQTGFSMTEVLQSPTQQKTLSGEDALILNQTQAGGNIPPPSYSVSDPPAADSTTSRGKGRHVASVPSKITSDSTIDSGSSISSESNNPPTTSQLTLTQYLSNLYCTGCSKHCSLLSPQCAIGVSQAAAAQQQYAAIYGSSTLN